MQILISCDYEVRYVIT